jgi:hypothetical protein
MVLMKIDGTRARNMRIRTKKNRNRSGVHIPDDLGQATSAIESEMT